MASLIWSLFTTVSSSAEQTSHLTPCNESFNILFECTWHNCYLELSMRMKLCTLFWGHHSRLLLLEHIKQYSSQVTANSPWLYASLRWVIHLNLENELASQCAKSQLGDVWNGFNCWESFCCYPEVWNDFQYRVKSEHGLWLIITKSNLIVKFPCGSYSCIQF